MLKKILIIFIVSLFFVNIVWADEAVQVNLNLSNEEVQIGDSFQVSISLKNASTGDLNISNINIPGIENFQQAGSRQSTKIQMINGETTVVSEKTLTLIALNEGEYKLGPVKIKSNTVDTSSNEATIKVSAKKEKSFFSSSDNDKQVIEKVTKNKIQSSTKKIWTNILTLTILIGLIFSFNKQRINVKNKNLEETVTQYKEKSKKSIDIPDKEDERFFEKTKKAILVYLSNNYDIDADVLTTTEIVKKLKVRNISQIDSIQKSLDLCDQGSFANNKQVKTDLIKEINLI